VPKPFTRCVPNSERGWGETTAAAGHVAGLRTSVRGEGMGRAPTGRGKAAGATTSRRGNGAQAGEKKRDGMAAQQEGKGGGDLGTGRPRSRRLCADLWDHSRRSGAAAGDLIGINDREGIAGGHGAGSQSHNLSACLSPFR